MSNIIEYKDTLIFHPGSYIEEILDELNITQKEFAHRLDVTPKLLSELINGETSLTSKTAVKLEKLTGIEYQTWMNIQNEYNKKVIEMDKFNTDNEEEILKNIDIKYLYKLKILQEKNYNLEQLIDVLRKQFCVSNLCYLKEFNSSVSYRSSELFNDKAIINANVMLELSINKVREIIKTPLNKNKLKETLPKIRDMLNKNIKECYTDLQNLLEECGIYIVFMPYLKCSNLHGAIKKFKNGSVLLLITDRKKAFDIFWFSVMHEIGHIINGDFISDIDDMDKYYSKEKKADEFAKNFLIDKYRYEKFIENKVFNEESILKFSNENNIKPIILIGRLKKENHVDYRRFSKYNEKYCIDFV